MLYVPLSYDRYAPISDYNNYNEIFEHMGRIIDQEGDICPCCHKHYRSPNDDNLCLVCGWERDLIQEANHDEDCCANRFSLNEARKRFNRRGADLTHLFKHAFKSLSASQIDFICNEFNIDSITLFGFSEKQLDYVCIILIINEGIEYYENGRHSKRYKILSKIEDTIIEHWRRTLGNLWWDDSFTREDTIEAHRYSNNHKKELEPEQKCGCFCCLEIFSSSEIKDWLIASNPCDQLGTAFCPKCGIDSVIGESSGYPITPEFLNAMNKEWFN